MQDITDVSIALAGNPNSGKTSLFNFITGSRQHVGNYPGVTVERKEGRVPIDDAIVTFIDVPGTYNLSPYTIEEHVARDEILSPKISCIITVIDATVIERGLYFLSQIIETGKPTVVALNMYDEFEDANNVLDTELLSQILGVPCIPTVGNRGRGVTELMATALKAARGEIDAVGKVHRFSHEMEHAIDETAELLGEGLNLNRRWAAVNLLLYGESFANSGYRKVLPGDIYTKVDVIRERLEDLEGRDINSIVAAGRYGYAAGAVAECMKTSEFQALTPTEKIDAVLTHRYLGLPIFLLVLWIMFQSTFTLGALPMTMIDNFFIWLGSTVSSVLPDGFLSSLIVDGIISGVGGVLIFLPNILILFFFISILEDSGYMARAAFIMDRLMHFLGLHGKSFLPMLIGFGCTVPAVMATRILDSRRERLITMFILPFISCGARIPVYVLLAGAFFGQKYAGTVIFSLYIVGMLLSFIFAKLFSFSNKVPSPFVMELPPYRIPTLRSVLLHIWERAYMYVRKAGTVILTASVILWFLMSYPKPADTGHDGNTKLPSSTAIEQSYAGRLGKLIEPALKPLGADWRMGVALGSGVAAKEIIVSTLATIYSISDEESGHGSKSLQDALKNDPTLNPVRAYGLMLFILIYVPCLAVLSVLRREAGGWRWVIAMIVYTLAIAWTVSYIFISIAERIV